MSQRYTGLPQGRFWRTQVANKLVWEASGWERLVCQHRRVQRKLLNQDRKVCASRDMGALSSPGNKCQSRQWWSCDLLKDWNCFFAGLI